jgi:hypothetical protein
MSSTILVSNTLSETDHQKLDVTMQNHLQYISRSSFNSEDDYRAMVLHTVGLHTALRLGESERVRMRDFTNSGETKKVLIKEPEVEQIRIIVDQAVGKAQYRDVRNLGMKPTN